MSRRVFLGAAVLVLGLVAGPLTARSAGATFTTCDTDPTVVLSNGVVVTMGAHIGVDPSFVTGVTYVLHAPRGTSVTSTSYDAYGYLENVQFVADQDWGTYLVDASVSTSAASWVNVTANATVSGHGSQQRSGLAFQHLYMFFGGF